MKDIFPTFEEINQGHYVYTLYDYRGTDDDGNPKYSKKLNIEIVMRCHSKYSELINKVYITRDRKLNNTGFKFEIAGNKYAYHFKYSEEGWQACINKIKSILEYYRNIIDEVLGSFKINH